MVKHGVEHWMVAPIASGHAGRPVKLGGVVFSAERGDKSITGLDIIVGQLIRGLQ